MGRPEFSKKWLPRKRDLNLFSAYGFPMKTSCSNFNTKEKTLRKVFVSDVISMFFSFFADAFLSGNSVNTAAKYII